MRPFRNLISVHCRSEAAYPGRPTAFSWHEAEYLVDAVLQSWREPGLICFLVAVPDAVAELVYDEGADQWHLRQLSPLPPEAP